jgi:hypothetical protein
METANALFSGAALIISILSLVVAQIADRRSRKAEDIRDLLGQKESVAFGALKLMRDGLPKKQRDRDLIIAAIMQACVFESSDRARALLYRVIQNGRPKYQSEFAGALLTVVTTFDAMDRYGFPKEQLDLARGRRRIETVQKVLNNNPTS